MLGASTHDLLLCGQAFAGIELVENVRVGGERHRRRVAGLARDVDDAAPLVDEQ
ncbi:MAG TPA: hypothetical protein VII98_01155 [Solirubrobacteraceae bacterium]